MGRIRMSSLAVRLTLAICFLLCLFQRIEAKPSPEHLLIETKDKGQGDYSDYHHGGHHGDYRGDYNRANGDNGKHAGLRILGNGEIMATTTVPSFIGALKIQNKASRINLKCNNQSKRTIWSATYIQILDNGWRSCQWQ